MDGFSYLVTGVGGPAGRSLSTELARRGRRVIGVDMHPVTDMPFSTEIVPPANSSRFVPNLIEIARRHEIRLVVPTVTEELPVLAAVRQTAARAGVPIAVGDARAVDVAADKWLTFLCLDLMGVPVPRTVLPADIATPADLVAKLGLPLLRKPRSGRGARGVSVHHDARSALRGLSDDRYLLQEYLPGAEYAVNLYLGIAGKVDGRVLHKLTLSSGEIGNGVQVRQVPDLDVGMLAVAAARAVGLTGAVDVDIRRRADGTPAVLEINARYGAHCAMVPEVIDALMHEHEVHVDA